MVRMRLMRRRRKLFSSFPLARKHRQAPQLFANLGDQANNGGGDGVGWLAASRHRNEPMLACL